MAFTINKFGKNFKQGGPLSINLRNQVIELAQLHSYREVGRSLRVDAKTVSNNSESPGVRLQNLWTTPGLPLNVVFKTPCCCRLWYNQKDHRLWENYGTIWLFMETLVFWSVCVSGAKTLPSRRVNFEVWLSKLWILIGQHKRFLSRVWTGSCKRRK